MALVTIAPQPVLAQAATDPTQFKVDFTDNDINYYDPRGNNVCGATTPTGQVVNPSANQTANVKTILGVVKSLNLNQKAALVALMTALQESNITNLANKNVPISLSNPDKQGEAQDHDSVGVFQQRPSTGWSTFGNGTSQDIVWQLMTVAYSAEAFLGVPDNAKLPAGLKQPSALHKGLQNVSGWESLPPGVAAQKVQISAFPDAYAKHQAAAQKLIDQYWDQSPAVPLPIPITGGTAAAGGSTQCGGGSSSLSSIILRYAWPDYHHAPYLIMKPDYEAAVKTAQANGVYVGGGIHPGVDCGGFVTLVMRNSGIDPTYNDQKGPVSGQKAYMDAHPNKFKRLTNVKSTADLQPGDINIRSDLGHTYLYVGKIPNFNGNAASASIDSWRTPMASNVSPGDFSDYWYRPLDASSNPIGK